jgi:hypothetical protein
MVPDTGLFAYVLYPVFALIKSHDPLNSVITKLSQATVNILATKPRYRSQKITLFPLPALPFLYPLL